MLELSLTPQEQYLVRSHQQFPNNSTYNIGYICACRTDIDLADLQATLTELHHTSANLTAIFRDGRKHILETTELPFSVVESTANDLSELQALFVAEKTTPFQLGEYPLYRCKLINSPIGKFFLVVFSHGINDGYGIKLYINKIMKHYQSKRRSTSDLNYLIRLAENSQPILPALNADQIDPLFPTINTITTNAMSERVLIDLADYPNLQRIMLANELSDNAISLTLMQRTLAAACGQVEFSIKHLLLGRNDRQAMITIAFMANATIQTINTATEFVELVQQNQQYLTIELKKPHPSYYTTQHQGQLPEVCYSYFSKMFTAPEGALFAPIEQPNHPEMWCDEIKLKVNVHKEEDGQLLFIFRGLETYVDSIVLQQLHTHLLEQLTLCEQHCA